VSSENRLLEEADLVFVTSERLRERAAPFSDRVHVFPFGVSLERFEAVRRGSDPLPDDVKSMTRPIVGYVGGLHQWIDQDLLAAVASQMPDATFVLVGPEQTGVSKLRECPNVHLLGMRQHARPAALREGLRRRPRALSSDVVHGERLSDEAERIPVDGHSRRGHRPAEIRRFNSRYDGIVHVAGDAAAFADAVRAALETASPGEVDRRVAVALENSWASRVVAMTRLIDEATERRAATRQRWDETLRRV